jgi:hypothetical protein
MSGIEAGRRTLGKASTAAKAKTESNRKPGIPIQVPVRPKPPGREACEIIGKDAEYTLVTGQYPVNTGTYLVGSGDGEPIEFCAIRLSDYDTPRKSEDKRFILGRRPRRAQDFANYKDIVAELKGKDQKWVDKDSPDRKDGYKDEDMIKEPFIYRPPSEVWPTAKVVIFESLLVVGIS